MESFQLTNARIYTMDPRQPLASSLVFRGGRVELIDPEDRPGSAERLDLGGRIVLPGLIDSHLHLRQYAETLGYINCETDTKELCLERVKERASRTPPGEWIWGHGWNHNSWTDGYGTAKELDLVAPDNPVYLTGMAIHAAWVNDEALRLAGITKDTPDPPGGKILRHVPRPHRGAVVEHHGVAEQRFEIGQSPFKRPGRSGKPVEGQPPRAAHF